MDELLGTGRQARVGERPTDVLRRVGLPLAVCEIRADAVIPAVAKEEAAKRWRVPESSLVVKGGYAAPRPKRCTKCGARYRPRTIKRKGVVLGLCPGPHAKERSPG